MPEKHLITSSQKPPADDESRLSGGLALLLEHGLDLHARLSPEGRFVDASRGLVSLLGYSFEYLSAARLRDVVESVDVAALEQALERLGDVAGDRECVTVRMIKSVTETAWVELRLIRDDGAGVLVAGRDLTEQRRREEELERAAAHDALTGLPNRALLAARIEQALAQRRRGGCGFALGVADLDGFKRINDSLGHGVGDALLRQVAGRLQSGLRSVDTVARIGGDEFVLVLPEIESREQAEGLARRLTESLQLPFVVGEHTLFTTVSLGLALHPEHASDAESLMHCADAALYRAKDLGRNGWQLYNQGLAAERSDYLKLEHAMFEAVRNGEFLLHYQPIARTDGTVVGAEALMRWPQPGRAMVPPMEFIPIAEANGLINLLGAWALRTGCMQAARWDGEGIPGLSISVNVSPRQFRHGDFCEQVRQALAESGIDPPRLVLEITEGVLVHNPEHAQGVLESLRGLGVRIAVDDFGTGYSSLSYLKRFPLSSLKIDRSFVRDMAQSSNDRVIVSAVLGLARELGLQVVAEGVEDAGQLEFLREKGCPLVQGYYIGKPMPAADFVSAEKARLARLDGETMSPEKQKVFDKLWAQMVQHGDFPTLSHSIHHIVTAVQSQSDHMEKLVSAVISDFSLTQKVLRLANSAMYAPFGGNVTTVSRAMLVLGQETVGHLALGLRLLDSFKGISTDREKAKQVLAEIMLTGLVARRLTEGVGAKEGEEAVVCALLSRLGELVCVFYAPVEWQRIEDMAAAEAVPLDAAAAKVLGVSLSELGQEIASRWGLPGRLRESLKPFEPAAVEQPLSHAGWLQAMSSYSAELARAMASGNPALTRAATERYAPLVALDAATTRATLDSLENEARTEGGWEGLADVYFVKPTSESLGKPADAEERLAAGVADITRSAKECQFSVLLYMALEVIKGSLGCSRVIAFVLDPASGRYSARAGFGEPGAEELTSLSFEGGFAPDVFHLTLSSKIPVHIENTKDVKIRPRIPAWHRNTLDDARSLMLLPVVVKGRAVALLYADWTSGEAAPLTLKETQLLKALVFEIENAIVPVPLRVIPGKGE